MWYLDTETRRLCHDDRGVQLSSDESDLCAALIAVHGARVHLAVLGRLIPHLVPASARAGLGVKLALAGLPNPVRRLGDDFAWCDAVSRVSGAVKLVAVCPEHLCTELHQLLRSHPETERADALHRVLFGCGKLTAP